MSITEQPFVKEVKEQTKFAITMPPSESSVSECSDSPASVTRSPPKGVAQKSSFY